MFIEWVCAVSYIALHSLMKTTTFGVYFCGYKIMRIELAFEMRREIKWKPDMEEKWNETWEMVVSRAMLLDIC